MARSKHDFANKTYRISRFVGDIPLLFQFWIYGGNTFAKTQERLQPDLIFWGYYDYLWILWSKSIPWCFMLSFPGIAFASSAEWSEASTSPSSWDCCLQGTRETVEPVRQKIQVFFLEAMWIILTLRKCLAFGRGISCGRTTAKVIIALSNWHLCQICSRNSLHMSPLRLAD